MPCPDSGQIKISDIVAEFGGSAPHAISEYYRNGANVPGNNTNVATSGQISLTQFYSAVNEIIHTHSSNATHQNYATVFGSNWASSVPKRIVVNSGVTIGGTSDHAMTLPSGMGGTLVIDNNGSIEGYSGASNGGAGGNAIHCVQTSGVTINNASGASIKAGGGGGGQGGTGGTGGNGGTGGTGGQGYYATVLGTVDDIPCGYVNQFGQQYCAGRFGNPISNWSAQACYWTGTDYHQRATCYRNAYTSGGSGGAGGTSGGSGGGGGAGGVGQGYNQSNTSGSTGSSGSSGGSGSNGSGGGTNAGTGGSGGSKGTGGTGGTGGAGGTFGNAGANGANGATGSTGSAGNTGANGNYTNGSGGSAGSNGSSGSSGSSGGAAGYYIYNRASITLNNSGTVAGQ